jgi:linoleate 8R-lipoxygenase/9,12-octadecadienoate 8-hydroperoxide 8R-isomerase
MVELHSSSEPTPESGLDKFRDKLDKGFKELAELISAVRRPMPTKTGDATYQHYPNDDPNLIQKIESTIKDLTSIGIPDIETLVTVQDKTKTGAAWDDKKYLMERLIQTATKFPDNSPTGNTVTNGFLTGLYNDLQHPPLS